MRKILQLGILTGLLLVGFSLACTFPISLIERLRTETPTLTRTAWPTLTGTAIPTSLPTIDDSRPAVPEPTIGISPTPTPKFAPFCQPSSANVFTPTPFQCQVPVAEQSSLYCADKVPYNLVLINEGSTYEVLNEEVTCNEAGTKDGRQLLTCTGPMAFSFDLRVCDPACAIPTFQASTTHCPQYYTFNDTLNCCEQEPQPVDQNCVVLKLQVKTCSIDCSVYDKEKTCDKNAYACEWDPYSNTCQLKKGK